MSDGIFIQSPESCPRGGGTLEYWGGVPIQKLIFSEIQPNLVCKLLTCMGHATAFLAPPPGALGRGQKVKYHYISSRAWGFAMARHRLCSSVYLCFSQMVSQVRCGT